MTFKQKVLGAALAAATTLSAAQALAVGGSHTLQPNENKKIYEFGNMKGYVTIQSTQPLNLRWIHAGQKRDVMLTNGSVTLELPADKIDGILEASNQGTMPASVTINENTQANNLAQTWMAFWGTAAGGHDSEVNKAHREVKRWVKKCFGLCKG